MGRREPTDADGTCADDHELGTLDDPEYGDDESVLVAGLCASMARQTPTAWFIDVQRKCILGVLRSVIDARLNPNPSPKARPREIEQWRADVRDDVSWLADDSDNHAFTFVRCCETFGLDPSAVRAVAIRATKKDLRRIKMCDPEEMHHKWASARDVREPTGRAARRQPRVRAVR